MIEHRADTPDGRDRQERAAAVAREGLTRALTLQHDSCVIPSGRVHRWLAYWELVAANDEEMIAGLLGEHRWQPLAEFDLEPSPA